MKCEQFLPWLESENYVRVTLARQHARRCESCRVAELMLDAVKQSLTQIDPLPERLKPAFATMGEVATVNLSEPAEDRRSLAGLWLAALAAAILIAISPWLFGLRRHANVAEQAHDRISAQADEQWFVGPITTFTIDSAAGLAQIESDLAALKTDVGAATAEVQRLSAEHELARVLVDYHRLFAGNDVR